MQTKRNNKILSFLFSIFLLICLLPTNHIMAFDNPTLKIENATGHTGELINVSVKLYNNPGVASSRLTLNYGSSLTLEEITFVDDGGVVPDELKSGMTVTWMSTKQDVVGDITFMTLKFRVTNDLRIQKEENITITNSEFVNYDEDDVFFDIVNGSITLIPAVPGDINNDGVLNMKDVVRASRYLAGHNVDVDETAIDTNGDQKINIKDLMRLLNYLVNNDVKVYYGSFYIRPCKYEASHIEANKALCETDGNIEYWYCEKCDKYYSNSDATLEISLEDTIIEKTGHNIVIDEAVPATKTSTGLTEGAHCSECKKVLVEQSIIPIPEADEYSIIYHLEDGDPYLLKLGIKQIINDGINYVSYTDLNNVIHSIELPAVYKEGQGLSENLPDLNEFLDGYKFLGYFDASNGGERIKTISNTDTGNKHLYAKWEKDTYTVRFDTSSLNGVTIDNKQYTVDVGLSLPSNSNETGVYNYIFVGWADDNGNLVKNINPGQTGNLTLHGVWNSKRNIAKPIDYKSQKPVVIQDKDNGQILFVYEIGVIENVPLFPTGQITNTSKGLQTITSETITSEYNEEYAKSIKKAISNATTNSESWTLSSSWSSVVNVDEEWANEHTDGSEDINDLVLSSKGTYLINSSNGGSTVDTTSSGNTVKTGSKDYNNTSSGEEHTDSKAAKLNINAMVHGKLNLGPIAKGGFEISGGYEQTNTTEDKTNKSTTEGSESYNESESYSSNTLSNTSSWNSLESYEDSQELSNSSTTKKVLSDVIKNVYHKGSSYIDGGEENGTQDFIYSEETNNEWSDAITLSNKKIESYSVTRQYTGDIEGWYRTVCAGRFNVYAIVGYDLANKSYYTYSYSVMDDETYNFVDFSTSSSFDDNEYSALEFEVPFDVKEYIDYLTTCTEGIVIDENGYVKEYNGDSQIVYIPSYYSYDNNNGKRSFVNVVGIDANAFANNDKIVAVYFNNYINTIPNGAFENCTSLRAVDVKVANIGTSAFENCYNLDTFNLSESIENIGKDAFKGVNEVTLTAGNKNVIDEVLESGAKNITLDISNAGIEENATLEILSSTEKIEIRGDKKEYKGLNIISNANHTIIDGIKFMECNRTPLIVNSDSLTLNQVEINTKDVGIKSEKENMDIYLYGNSYINSLRESILCKNIKVIKNPKAVGIETKLHLSNDIYTTSENIAGQSLFVFDNGKQIKRISDEDYDVRFNGMFDINLVLNGGLLSNNESLTLQAFKNEPIKDLPIPTKENYIFLGWFDINDEEKKNGDIIDSSVFEDISLYAKWIGEDHIIHLNMNYDGASVVDDIVVKYNQPIIGLDTPTRKGYSFTGWYDEENNKQYSNNDLFTENRDVLLTAHWQQNNYLINFNANGGSNLSFKQKEVMYDGHVGALPNATRDYYYLDGWFTEPNGGKKYEESSIVDLEENTTLYAHWKEKELSEWTIDSNVPSDAKIVNEYWKYDRHIGSYDSSLVNQGWTLVDTSLEEIGSGNVEYATFPSGFDTSNAIYNSLAKEPVAEYDDGSNVRKVENIFGGYIYWHWMYNAPYDNNPDINKNRIISQKSGNTSTAHPSWYFGYFDAIKSTVDCPYLDSSNNYQAGNNSNLPCYNCHNIITDTASAKCDRYFRFEYNISKYKDYRRIYTYEQYGLISDKPVYEVDGNVSIQHFVQYIPR